MENLLNGGFDAAAAEEWASALTAAHARRKSLDMFSGRIRTVPTEECIRMLSGIEMLADLLGEEILEGAAESGEGGRCFFYRGMKFFQPDHAEARRAAQIRRECSLRHAEHALQNYEHLKGSSCPDPDRGKERRIISDGLRLLIREIRAGNGEESGADQMHGSREYSLRDAENALRSWGKTLKCAEGAPMEEYLRAMAGGIELLVMEMKAEEGDSGGEAAG